MEPEVKDKPVNDKAAPASADEKDSRGVPWENRAKELERKLKDVEARLAAAPAAPQPAPVPEDKQKRLMEFVEDPDGYMDRHYQQRKFNEELPQAEKWLSMQAHFTNWDDAKAVIHEHRINFQNPMLGARTVNELLKARAL